VLDALTTQSIEGFYKRWSPQAFAFARHLFGDGNRAERALQEAFHTYIEWELPLDEADPPAFLFLFVLDYARKDAPEQTSTKQHLALPEALLSIPATERAVFILQAVMGWDDLLVGETVELPVQEVRKHMMKALRALRALMSKSPFTK